MRRDYIAVAECGAGRSSMYRCSGQDGGDCRAEEKKEEVERSGSERMALDGVYLLRRRARSFVGC